MDRRKELSNVVSGLYGSFISRNNDVAGYWGIGKLCLLAQERETGIVELNLLTETIAPETTQFARLLRGYHSFLKRHLSARRIPLTWVVSANIELNFRPEDRPKKHIPIVSWGSLFKLTVAIKDDKNKEHIACGFSYCGPHNPTKEHQSVGERF
ncbi:hypothetical protein [Pseudothauera rhizosphaerae]|uniref:Uncharacterized protein n=1 Tax=Pseudothauera rhizosphaerae TaxID=2565932 RepID=A0A4S4AQK4_9RHOO|nr:hypothetical protein [Pseudothauera rhizosphaerae]THF61967.1 hypothetical protein E6O51_07325 [Pseudothauera rhizosphaerae]